MSERETQRTTDVDDTSEFDVDLDDSLSEAVTAHNSPATDETPDTRTEPNSTDLSGGFVRTAYDTTVGRVLSTRGLGIALGVTLIFSFVFSLVPFLGVLGQLLGIGVAGFLYGLVGSEGRYLELLIAGAAVGGGSALLGNLLVITFGSLTGLLGVGVLGGAVAAVAGHYFGRDLNDGLTRDV